MRKPRETAAFVTDLVQRMLPCATFEELDASFDQRGIERALMGFPDKSTEALVIYTLNRLRIQESVPHLPEYALTVESCERAAVRLAMVYLKRIGFLSEFRETPEHFAWRCNPLHPLAETAARLERTHHALWVAARELWTSPCLERTPLPS